MIFLGPTVTRQRRYERQRSLATQSEYDSVIAHANKTASTVYWKCFLCPSSIAIVEQQHNAGLRIMPCGAEDNTSDTTFLQFKL